MIDPQSTAPPFVAVCIATYQRPAGIRHLLHSLDGIKIGLDPIRVQVIIVDNDPKNPAFGSQQAAQEHCRWPVIYEKESNKGIVQARNHCLALVPPEATHIAFVDDDETVTPFWLNSLLWTMAETGATAVQGPVQPAYECPPPAWVARLGIFELGPFVQGAPLGFAATNNVLIDADFLRRHQLHFDDRFNLTGGEDEEMFGRLRGLGGAIHASADAIVRDAVPANRMTLRWVLTRWHRMGNTLGRIAIYRQQGRFKRVVKGLGAVGIGAVRALAYAPFRRDKAILGLMLAARGAGMLSAFFNLTTEEYSAARVARDRVRGH